MPTFTEPPSGSPFLSVFEKDPDRPAAKLRTLILSDLKGVPQRIAQLSQWLSARNYSFTVDLVLVIGVSRPAPDCKTTHQALAEQANDSATIAQLENICPRVVYIPGLHEHPTAWESKDHAPPRLTPFSHNAIAGPLHIAPDLYIVHRRFADGISDKPVHHLPVSWRHTIYARLTRPGRFRIPPHPSAIVLCSSQLPDDHTSKSKAMGLLRTVRSLLSLNRGSTPDLDFILAIAPPKMQRVPSSSSVFRLAERTLDPGSFSDGYFSLATFVRPDVWDPEVEPDVDDEQLTCESAWEVENVTKYNLDHKLTDDDEADQADIDEETFNHGINDDSSDDDDDNGFDKRTYFPDNDTSEFKSEDFYGSNRAQTSDDTDRTSSMSTDFHNCQKSHSDKQGHVMYLQNFTGDKSADALSDMRSTTKGTGATENFRDLGRELETNQPST